MKLLIKSALIALAITATAAPVQAETLRHITVTGEGQTTGAPDLATITLGVTNQSKNAADAMRQTSEVTKAVLDQLTSAGIAERDMQTSQLSLSPQWNYRNSSGQEANEITGFVASNLVTVKVRDLSKLGEVLDQVIANGANNFRGLSFGFADPEPQLDQARQAAVKDALRKAKLYASAADLTLGPVQSISDVQSSGSTMVFAEARMAADSAVPIAQGEVSVSAKVTMVIAIGE